MNFTYAEGATPLDPDMISGLIPALSTQAELNEFEQRNIADAARWAGRSRTLKRELLTAGGLRLLHRRMFDITWKWAGVFRQVGTNIGIDWPQIPMQLASLCADTQYQIDHSVFSWEELAARFHHRLVFIHPFPNGNGRHARLAADMLLSYHGQPSFSWGAATAGALSLVEDNSIRRAYLTALRAADQGEFALLLEFVRS